MIDIEKTEGIIFPEYLVKNGLDGLTHIGHVVHFGQLIAERACPQKMVDVLLGCYLHDIGRGRNPPKMTHGDAGAPIARRILQTHFPDSDIEKIVSAVQFHDRGRTTSDVVIGSIWDADRLSLYRIGKTPDPARLSTPESVILIPYAENFIKEHMHEY